MMPAQLLYFRYLSKHILAAGRQGFCRLKLPQVPNLYSPRSAEHDHSEDAVMGILRRAELASERHSGLYSEKIQWLT